MRNRHQVNHLITTPRGRHFTSLTADSSNHQLLPEALEDFRSRGFFLTVIFGTRRLVARGGIVETERPTTKLIRPRSFVTETRTSRMRIVLLHLASPAFSPAFGRPSLPFWGFSWARRLLPLSLIDATFCHRILRHGTFHRTLQWCIDGSGKSVTTLLVRTRQQNPRRQLLLIQIAKIKSFDIPNSCTSLARDSLPPRSSVSRGAVKFDGLRQDIYVR